MKYVFNSRDEAREYEVQAGDTLESIAADECPDQCDWAMLARYNWGSDLPREVVRALVETVGVRTTDLSNAGLLASPGQMALHPDPDFSPRLKIPELWTTEGLAVEQTHTIKIKPIPKPASAISVLTLDKWFIPDVETCEIEYGLEGDGECADFVQLDVFGSQYCECTDWNDGLGTYGDPAALEDVPVFTKDLSAQAEERATYGMPEGEGWKGESTATEGMLSRTTGMADTRYINAAFSPYTAHFRYWKQSADGHENAQLALKPFWPQWEETGTEPAVTAVVEPGHVRVQWNNAAQADRGVLEIRDKNNQLVHLAAISDDNLTPGNKEQRWNRGYRADAQNSRFGSVYVDDSALGANSENAPYSYKVTTFVRTKRDASLRVEWEIKNTGLLERGVLLVTDGNGRLVFHKPLPVEKLQQGDQFYEWDGQYAQGITNSRDGNTVILEDMPYRVQIQAHTGIGHEEGLALAAMHTEVRLYVHPETVVPGDLMYDPYYRAQQSMLLAPGSLVPGDPPAEDDGTKWYRYKLAEYGFHPGPVTDADAADDDYHIALKEFKRSVPKRGDVEAPNFSRMDVDENENNQTKRAIRTIRNSDKRKWFGNKTRVLANSNDPYLTDNQVKTMIRDPGAEMIVWVDDRQYYTGEGPGSRQSRDERNRTFLSGSREANRFALRNYRSHMKTRDGRTDTDGDSIPRPWIPLKVSLRVMSRNTGLYDEANVVVDLATEQTMRRAIGPLRVDWTFDELPRDVSTIPHRPPAGADAYDNDYVRSRYYVDWAINQNKGTHRRVDTGRDAIYTNCKAELGGIRPDNDADLNTYYQKAFGYDDLSLAPWQAAAVGATESIATVVHDHIADGQVEGTDLFLRLIGTSGAYFNPSRIAGDGYRVRAEVQFDEFGNYHFPNLETLKARYPVRPQAHTARLRIWRRSSIRGYMCWANNTGHWPGLLNDFRNLYRAAHVYFVFEQDDNRVFNLNDIFNPNTRSQRRRYKKIIKNNLPPNRDRLERTSRMNLHGEYLWPWVHEGSVWPYESDEGVTHNAAYADLRETGTNTWRVFRYALLYGVLKEIEKQGVLRGHLFVEFLSTPRFYLEEYRCGGSATDHRYWYFREHGTAQGGLNNQRCPGPFCNGTGLLSRRARLTATGTTVNKTKIPLPAVGVALGATWLFTSSNSETWVHEIGHHRHLEHAANGPGAEFATSHPQAGARLHDNQDNPNVPVAPDEEDSERKWDRRCIMSYNKDAPRYFCGKCILRNRGWKVRDLGFPGTDKTET